MSKFIRQDGAWVPAEQVRAVAAQVGIVRDFADPLWCPADGRHHGSRSTYDAAVREAGCEIVGRKEMRRMQDGPRFRGSNGMEPVRDTLRRLVNQ